LIRRSSFLYGLFSGDVGIMSVSASWAGLDDMQERGLPYIVASLGCILHYCFMNGMNGFFSNFTDLKGSPSAPVFRLRG
jgi:hypothetical protein